MKFTIITVCYNPGKIIRSAMESVLSQNYSDIEYIIIDGGSSDGTVGLVESYGQRISRFLSEPDDGLYHAMNKGINLATGDVVGFLNADDFYVDDNVIEKVAEAMLDKDVDCCYGNLEYVAENNLDKTVRRWKSQPYRSGLFKKGWHPPHPTFFAKKVIFDKYGGFNLNYEIGADYELMLRFLEKHGVKSCHVPRVLVKMRIGGKSNKNLWQVIKANVECFRAWKKNGLKISPVIMLKKPASKLLQYIKK